jgi:hypothetical protein
MNCGRVGDDTGVIAWLNHDGKGDRVHQRGPTNYQAEQERIAHLDRKIQVFIRASLDDHTTGKMQS